MAVWTMKTLMGVFALKSNLGLTKPEWESPMEGLFYQEAESQINGLVIQHPIGRYRVDFAVPAEMIAIEIDGREFHRANFNQVVNDRERQSEIEAQGWTVIRFTGSEVYRNPGLCVSQVRRIMWINQLRQRGD